MKLETKINLMNWYEFEVWSLKQKTLTFISQIERLFS